MAKKATMKDYIIPEEIKQNCTNSLSGPVQLAKNTKTDQSYIPPKKDGYRRLKKTDYSWDQTIKKVSFYLNGCENVQASSNVKIYYNPENKNQVCFILTSSDNKEYIFNLPPFMGNINQKIDPIIKVRSSYISISLTKERAIKWSHLTNKDKLAAEDKKKMDVPDIKEGEDPQKSLMNMMKKMYDDGDDEMKRTLNKAWEQGQNKKNGMGDLPGMSDMAGMGM